VIVGSRPAGVARHARTEARGTHAPRRALRGAAPARRHPVGGQLAEGVQMGSVLRGYVQQVAYVLGQRVHGHVVQPTATYGSQTP
jgi:hypothetical protein